MAGMRSLVLSLLGFAYGAVAPAASPEPPASAAHVDHLILGTRDLDEGKTFESRDRVASVEHPAVNRRVVGSNPT